MRTIVLLAFTLIALPVTKAYCQTPVYTSYTTVENRAKSYKGMMERSIQKNLLLPLADSTEEIWEDAMYTLELLLHRSPLVDSRVRLAVNYFPKASASFKRSLLELLYTNYRSAFTTEVQQLLTDIHEPKVYAMAIEYLVADTLRKADKDLLAKVTTEKYGIEANAHPILKAMLLRLKGATGNPGKQLLKQFFSKEYLNGKVLLFSIQRKNRDYPGLAIVRDTAGTFLVDSGNLFNVKHFARSISNLPFYLTNGNTPQGLFTMYAFGVSRSQALGPTTNIQLEMPVESKLSKFFKDSTIKDSVWTTAWYEKLLPSLAKGFEPLYQAYYAGLAGRTEIIAHGTTIDPAYYQGKPYYPHTPSLGCLTTSEKWENGFRVESNQQKLVDAIIKAGGPRGYCIVIELDNKQAPVTVNDIESYIEGINLSK